MATPVPVAVQRTLDRKKQNYQTKLNPDVAKFDLTGQERKMLERAGDIPTLKDDPREQAQAQAAQAVRAGNRTKALAEIEERKASFQRDPVLEQSVISKLGFTPKSKQETALAAKTAYSPDQISRMDERTKKDLGLLEQDISQVGQTVYNPDQLRMLGLSEEQIKSLAGTGDPANQAFAGQMAIGDPNTALGILQEALNAKSNVTNQRLGTSDLYAQAGLPGSGVMGSAILQQSLNERSREINDKVNGFRKRVTEGADSLAQVLKKYELTLDVFEKQKAELLKVHEANQAYQRQLDLLEQQYQIKQKYEGEAASKWVYNTSLGAFVNDEGDVKYIDPQTSDAKGNLIDITSELGVDAATAANCVKYIRSKYAPNMREGLWTIEDKRRAVDPSIAVPNIGDIVFTTESYPGTNTGHVARIVGFDGDQMILEEANYRAGKVTTGRALSVNDPKVLGFYREGETPAGLISSEANPIFPESLEKEGVAPLGVETYSGGNGSATAPNTYGDLMEQFDNVNSYFTYTSTRDDNKNVFQKYIDTGNYSAANEYIKTLAKSKMSAKQKEDLIGLTTSKTISSEAVSKIKDLELNHLDYYTSLIQKGVKYGNFSKDQEWVKIQQLVEQAVSPLRKALLGTQIPVHEMARAQLQFPNDEDDTLSLITKLNGLKNIADFIETATYDFYRGVQRD